METTLVEYVWIDGTDPVPHLRSKTKVVVNGDPPMWNFDGSSTNQADGSSSDCLLKPVKTIPDPFRGGFHKIALCEVLNADGTPHKTNFRARLSEVLENGGSDLKLWLGFEQEYVFFKDGRPLGWPTASRSYPRPQGPYYCGVGADEAPGREIAEEHLHNCIAAKLQIYGLNAEVMLGQWEYQIGPRSQTEAGMSLDICDQLWLSRYILYRTAEQFETVVSIDVKPVEGDWNGSGCHTNFSTSKMRSGNASFPSIIEKLAMHHDEHIAEYGHDLAKRLTGKHETCSINEFKSGSSDRTASIRIPVSSAETGQGYLEDRRPGSNCDPYRVGSRLLQTLVGVA